jgi:hypothetical protein
MKVSVDRLIAWHIVIVYVMKDLYQIDTKIDKDKFEILWQQLLEAQR